MLAEREAESKDLRVSISELEANTDILHSKFQAAFAQMEEEADENEAMIEGLQAERERLEILTVALKEVIFYFLL